MIPEMISGTSNGFISLLNLPTSSVTLSLQKHESLVLGLAASLSGRYVASASDDKTVLVSQTSDLSEVCLFRGHSQAVRAVVILSDEDTVVSGSLDYSIRVWSIMAAACTRVLDEHQQYVEAIALHRSGRYFVSAGSDKTAILWDSKSFQPVRRINCQNRIGGIAFGDDGDLVVGVLGFGAVVVDYMTGSRTGQLSTLSAWSYGLDAQQGCYYYYQY